MPSAAVKSISPLFPSNIPISTVPLSIARLEKYRATFWGRLPAWRPHGNPGWLRHLYSHAGRFRPGARRRSVPDHRDLCQLDRKWPAVTFFPQSLPRFHRQRYRSFAGRQRISLKHSNGRIHQYSVTLERQIKDVGLRLTYTGSRDIGLNYLINIDKPQPSLAPFAQSSLPYPQYTSASYWRSNGEKSSTRSRLKRNEKWGN